MSKLLVKQVRSAVISAAMDVGIEDPKAIREILIEAAMGVKTMSVAGVKAAQSKGQYTYQISSC